MTTLVAQPNVLHGELIGALARPDPEPALEQAFVQLSRGADMQLLLAMIKAMVRAGLAGIAVRLLRSSSTVLATQPQLASLAMQLEAMPSGEVPRDIVQCRIHSNHKALSRSQPHLANILKQPVSRVMASVTFYKSTKGNQYVIRDSNAAKLEFAFPFADHITHAAAATLENVSIGTSFLITGVPSVPLWERLLALRLENGYVPPVDLVETEIDSFIAWLGLIEDVRCLQGERLSLFVGRDALEQYQRALVAQPCRHLAPTIITNMRPHWQPPPIRCDMFEEIGRAHRIRNGSLRKELDAWYSNKGTEYWRLRFSQTSNEAPLRIAGLTSRFSTVMQHAMRDLASAFRRRGREFDVIKQSDDHVAGVDVVGEINRIKPDLIVVINHLRSELADAIPPNVPYVCWIQDYMQQLSTREAGRSVGEFDMVFCHSPAVLTSAYGYSADRVLPTHNLTSQDVFDATPVPDADKEQYLCDLSYVGHGWETPEQLVEEIGRQNRAFGRYMHEAALLAKRRLTEVGYVTTQDLVSIIVTAEGMSSHPPLTPQARRSLVVPSVQRIIDRIFRHQTLEWAAEWVTRTGRSFRIFGIGWDRHPTLRRFACGPVENAYPLRCLYQASIIGLQVNAYGSLHQRLLDGIASGGFMLTRFNPADFIRAPFLAIQSYIQSNSIHDLAALLDHANKNPALRNELATIERLTGTRIASMDDPDRSRHVAEHIHCASLTEHDFTDDGLFDMLRNLHSIPHRVAGDVDCFAHTTFGSKQQFNELLDRYIADGAQRDSISRRMRQSVIQHDTYDTLVTTIMNSWRSRFNAGRGS